MKLRSPHAAGFAGTAACLVLGLGSRSPFRGFLDRKLRFAIVRNAFQRSVQLHTQTLITKILLFQLLVLRASLSLSLPQSPHIHGLYLLGCS